MNFEGSNDQKKAWVLLTTLGIDDDTIIRVQFANLLEEP